MARIVVLGAGVCGLAAGLMLRRDGHEVTVLERDAAPTPDSIEDAWEHWERTGVAQFRQAHYMQRLGRDSVNFVFQFQLRHNLPSGFHRKIEDAVSGRGIKQRDGRTRVKLLVFGG